MEAGSPGSERPTLFTRMSMRPYFCMQASTMACASLDFVPSHTMASTVPPSSRMIRTVFCAAVSLRSVPKMRAPCRASRVAIACPFPQPSPTEPKPVTSATLLSNLSMLIDMAFMKNGMQFRPFLEIKGLSTIGKFVKDGCGVAILPESGAQLVMEEGMYIIPLRNAPQRTVGIITRNESSLSGFAKQTIEWLCTANSIAVNYNSETQNEGSSGNETGRIASGHSHA